MSLMPSCKDIAEHASHYVDRHMPLHKRLGFMLHIFICVDCRRYIQQLKLTIATIATIGKSPEAAVPEINPQQVSDIVDHLQQHARENTRHH